MDGMPAHIRSFRVCRIPAPPRLLSSAEAPKVDLALIPHLPAVSSLPLRDLGRPAARSHGENGTAAPQSPPPRYGVATIVSAHRHLRRRQSPRVRISRCGTPAARDDAPVLRRVHRRARW